MYDTGKAVHRGIVAAGAPPGAAACPAPASPAPASGSRPGCCCVRSCCAGMVKEVARPQRGDEVLAAACGAGGMGSPSAVTCGSGARGATERRQCADGSGECALHCGPLQCVASNVVVSASHHIPGLQAAQEENRPACDKAQVECRRMGQTNMVMLRATQICSSRVQWVRSRVRTRQFTWPAQQPPPTAAQHVVARAAGATAPPACWPATAQASALHANPDQPWPA